MSRSSTVVALVALLGGRALADDTPPAPANPDTDPKPPPGDERDDDRDLDHDGAHRTDTTTKPPDPTGDPTDRPLFAPRLGRDAMRDIIVDTPGERSSLNITVIASMGAVALGAGIFGLYFHLQGHTAANTVASGGFTGKFWTPHDQAEVDKAERDRVRAIVLYSAGGAVLVAAVIALIASDPKATRTVIHPHAAMLAPTDGGVIVARGWTF